MALNQPIIFPFAAVYVGDASATSTRLSKVRALRTAGARITEGYPTVWEPSLGRRIRSGNNVLKVTLTFHGDSDAVVRLAKGLPLTETDMNSVQGDSVYSLFLQAPTRDSKSSYYFPNVQTERTYDITYAKAPALTVISFVAETRDINTILSYKELDTNLIAIMAGKSPI